MEGAVKMPWQLYDRLPKKLRRSLDSTDAKCEGGFVSANAILAGIAGAGETRFQVKTDAQGDKAREIALFIGLSCAYTEISNSAGRRLADLAKDLVAWARSHDEENGTRLLDCIDAGGLLADAYIDDIASQQRAGGMVN